LGVDGSSDLLPMRDYFAQANERTWSASRSSTSTRSTTSSDCRRDRVDFLFIAGDLSQSMACRQWSTQSVAAIERVATVCRAKRMPWASALDRPARAAELGA